MLVGVAPLPLSFPPFGTQAFYIINRSNCLNICNTVYYMLPQKQTARNPQYYAAVLVINTIFLLKMLKQEGIKEGVRRTVKGFCESTSLHGYSYLNNANSILLKFFWFLVIMAATSFGIVLLVQNTIEYLNANIVTTI